jgi:hypothetical protein
LNTISQEPLGRENLEQILYASSALPDLKGCFVANSLREISILPKAAQSMIEEHIQSLRSAILKNLIIKNFTHHKTKHNLEVLADIFLNFNLGLALSLNMGVQTSLDEQVKKFLNFIFSSI